MRILIAGCGYVGTALGHRLVEAGHDVIAVRRDASVLPDVFDRRSLELTDPDAIATLPDVAAIAITVSADGRDVDAYRHAYVDTVAALRDEFTGRSTPPGRWLFTSSTAVYGDTGGDWVDEDTPTDPSSDTGEVLVEAESLVATLPSSVSVRLGGIYGPTRTRLLDSVADGTATCPPEPAWTNRIHRDDAATICAVLLTAATVPPVVNGVDEDPAERCEVLRWIADRLGVPPPEVGVGRSRSNKRVRSLHRDGIGVTLAHPTFRSGYDQMIDDREPTP